jgi:guanine deaminase
MPCPTIAHEDFSEKFYWAVSLVWRVVDILWQAMVKEQHTMHQHFLREAIRLSIEKMQAGQGGPFGAVVVKDGGIVGVGFNCVTTTNDPTAHAEIVAIRDACARLGTFSLTGCEIYSSCEPCPMCLAAVYWARLERLHYAATREDAAAAGFDDAHVYREIPLPPAERSLPTTQDLRQEALAAFDAWLKKEDRIEY